MATCMLTAGLFRLSLAPPSSEIFSALSEPERTLLKSTPKEGTMQRIPIIANIYGYAVCLIAVIVFFAGTAAFIGGAFGAVHPTPFHPFMTRNIRIERGPLPGNMMWRGHAGAMHAGAIQHPGMMPQAAIPSTAHRASMLANARFAAIRRMTIALAMLVLAGILFARHWRWLQVE